MGPPTSEAAAAAAAKEAAPAALSWSDEGNAVVVRVPLPSGAAASNADDVVVDAAGGGLVVSLASSKTELVRVVQLYGTVDASKVSRSVSKGKGKDGGWEVVATLPKLDADGRWTSLEARSPPHAADDDEDDSSSSGPAAALAEREHIARLLTAAKEGDFDELKAAAEKYRGDNADGRDGGDDAATAAAAKQFSGVDAIKDGNGRSVLHFAVAGKNAACAEWLVDECGVDVNAMDDSSAFFSPRSTTTTADSAAAA